MSFKRQLLPPFFSHGESLTSDMADIGIRVAKNLPKEEANIENTLIGASIEGMKGDYRTLSLLVDWIGIHAERINVDRLTQIIKFFPDKKLKIFWTAIAQWQKSDWRFRKLAKLYRGDSLNLLEERGDFLIRKHGEDKRFLNSAIRIPDQFLRHRPQDILTPEELSKRHRAYYYRILIGPAYRADMWALLERYPKLSPSELARKTYGSFPTAWKVKRDWILLNQKKQKKAA
jgi:hypothetical protein